MKLSLTTYTLKEWTEAPKNFILKKSLNGKDVEVVKRDFWTFLDTLFNKDNYKFKNVLDVVNSDPARKEFSDTEFRKQLGNSITKYNTPSQFDKICNRARAALQLHTSPASATVRVTAPSHQQKTQIITTVRANVETYKKLLSEVFSSGSGKSTTCSINHSTGEIGEGSGAILALGARSSHLQRFRELMGHDSERHFGLLTENHPMGTETLAEVKTSEAVIALEVFMYIIDQSLVGNLSNTLSEDKLASFCADEQLGRIIDEIAQARVNNDDAAKRKYPEIVLLKQSDIIPVDYKTLTDAELKVALQTAPLGSPQKTAANQELFTRLMTSPGGVYHPGYGIVKNKENVENYMKSSDCVRHQKSVKVYCDKTLSKEVAMKMATEREPVNITQGRHYDEKRAAALFGYNSSYFECTKDDKTVGTPVTSIYSETFWWNPPGTKAAPKELSILHVYAPALDIGSQPHVTDYVVPPASSKQRPPEQWDLGSCTLNKDVYRTHMQNMADTIVAAAVENRNTAFEGQGIKRVVIPLVGQANFVSMLNDDSKKEAMNIFVATLATALKKHADELKELPIILSEYIPGEADSAFTGLSEAIKESGVQLGKITGDIGGLANAHDLIVNAWDPHSAPGNGNDKDNSFDGQVGRRTAVLATATSWFNPLLLDPSRYKSV